MKPKQLNFVNGRAETPFGAYHLDCEYECRWRFSDGTYSERFPSVEEAQAAAQADFERRVIATIDDLDIVKVNPDGTFPGWRITGRVG